MGRDPMAGAENKKTKNKKDQLRLKYKKNAIWQQEKWKRRIKQTYRTDASQPHLLEQHHAARVGRTRHIRCV
jgi:hypothetical protein